jgi:hypothetical protein
VGEGIAFQLPILDVLSGRRSILVAGAGGGFDIYSGLPVALALRREGFDVHLANLTFTSLGCVTQAEQPLPGLVGVTAASQCSHWYFPEGHLARWYQDRGDDVTIWCFAKTGVVPLRAMYAHLVRQLAVEAVVLVDGGIDSLLRGDEFALGTPTEDATSIAAVHGLSVPLKLLACTALGAEKADDISHAQVLENIAALTAEGAFLGATALTKGSPEGDAFIDAGARGIEHTPLRPSVIVSSMISALEGRFGDFHATARTHGSELWISPLMTLYWFFRLEAVAKRNLYLDRIAQTQDMRQVFDAIQEFRAERKRRGRDRFPI